MGVHGLWKLLEAAGKPVPLETLENKVLAVDVSIWLHQMMKGFQDSRGAPLPNAHLLGLFHRVCKLLYYRIKPVFVFDGGVPLLKRQTIAARKQLKKQAFHNAAEAKEKLLKNLVKRNAVRQIIDGQKIPTETQSDNLDKDDMFMLPPMPEEVENDQSDDESSLRLQVFMESSSSDDSEPETKPKIQRFDNNKLDLHTLDVHSEEFCSLPADVRHDILSELKETRKQNSWGRLHEMPEESGEFSSYQLGRLIKRRNVQVSLEKAEKEMGGKVMRINELQELMTAQGVKIIEENTIIESSSQRIASDSSTRYVLCKDTTSGDQGPKSIETIDSKSSELESNQLFNEQTEFIAKMAENMLQEMKKKKSETKLNHEEPSDHIIEDEDVSELIPSSATPAANTILADSWSSDDDVQSDVIEKSEKLQKDKSNNASEMPEDLLQSTVNVSDTLTSSMRDENECPSSIGSFDEDLSDSILKDFPKTEKQNLKQIAVGSSVSDNTDKAISNSKIFGEVLKHTPVSIITHDHDLHVVSSVGNKIESCPERKQAIEIVIRPEEKPDENDIFADIFEESQQSKPSFSRKTRENTMHGLALSEVEKLPNYNVERKSHLNEYEHNIQMIDAKAISEASIGKKTSSAADFEVQMVSSDDEEIDAGFDNQSIGPEDPSTSQEANLSVSSLLFSKAPASPSEWRDMEKSLQEEQLGLQKERGRQERLAASITDQMCVEAQELLQLFGVPYVVAPMEAEAQCAFLDAISLTEGSITDDSDIWLFGGKKVYKNFFNQKKHVLQFTLSNINHYFKLSREQLVQLALLVGSDYTTGIQGIGPVTALEVIAAFHGKSEADPVQCALKGLSQFKDWWNGGRPHKSNHMRLLDRKLKNIKFSEGFPSQAVVEAYLRPSVEDSQETFSWGALDLPALREFARSKFGWTASKTDEILLPVAKRWSDRSSQRTIESYFNFQPQLVEGLNKMSKRVQNAVTLMESDNEDVDDPNPVQGSSFVRKNPGKKRTSSPSTKSAKRQRKKNESQSSSIEIGPDVDDGYEKHVKDTSRELPVRAPTVPRERSSTGVKRVGVKSLKVLDEDHSSQISDESSTQLLVSKNPQRLVKRSSESISNNAAPKRQAMSRKPVKKKVTVDESEGVLNVVEEPARICNRDKSINVQPSKSVASCSFSGINEDGHSQSENCKDDKSSCQDFPSELAALSDMNWEDDPWADEQVNNVTTGDSRSKFYFGGVRPNKVKRPLRTTPPNRVSGDARGVQPGWLTQERFQSRSTAWVDSVHRKKEETIPQRERDQRALEEAKMKAISVVKASEARQASRLLGGSKRRRGRAKPMRKILPEHNLSESSSDD